MAGDVKPQTKLLANRVGARLNYVRFERNHLLGPKQSGKSAAIERSPEQSRAPRISLWLAGVTDWLAAQEQFEGASEREAGSGVALESS